MDICTKESFEQLLTPLQDLLLNVIYHKIHNREIALEIFHNVVVSGMANFHQLKDKDKFPAWIFAITRNAIVTYIRKESKKKKVETPVDIQDPANAALLKNYTTGLSVEQTVLDKDEKREIQEAVNSLDALDRIIILLTYYQNMRMREVAELLDMSLSAVKMRKRRALEKLREKLKK